jgi:hypothetical protein
MTMAAHHNGGPRRPARTVSQSLSATGNTNPVVAKSGFLSVQGTWAGTINLEVDPSNTDTWSSITDLTGVAAAFTGNVNVAFDNGAATKTRVKFTRTSGTAVIALIGD